MNSMIGYFGIIIHNNIKKYNESRTIASKIVKRQRRKNIFNKEELLLVVSANLERHKLNHHCRKSVGVLGINHKSVYTPTIKLQRGLGQFKIDGVNINIVEPGFCEPTLNRRKYTENAFLETTESWNDRLKGGSPIESYMVEGNEDLPRDSEPRISQNTT